MPRNPINVSKEQENTEDLTTSSTNTKLEGINAELIAKRDAVRGRRVQRNSINSGSENRKKRRKYVGRVARLDVSHFYEQYPEIFDGMVLRWVNDENGEVQRMERTDWIKVHLDGEHQYSDRATGGDDNKGSSLVRIPAGRGKNYDNIYAVLMMKDKEYFEEDEVQYQRDQYAAQTQALKRGANQSQDDERVGNADKKSFYAPNTGEGDRGMSIKQQEIEEG
jgi:hypothetical protein